MVLLHVEIFLQLNFAGIHPEGAAAARDETATAFSPILLLVGRELSSTSTLLTQG